MKIPHRKNVQTYGSCALESRIYSMIYGLKCDTGIKHSQV